jgi:hypothetical protein
MTDVRPSADIRAAQTDRAGPNCGRTGEFVQSPIPANEFLLRLSHATRQRERDRSGPVDVVASHARELPQVLKFDRIQSGC